VATSTPSTVQVSSVEPLSVIITSTCSRGNFWASSASSRAGRNAERLWVLTATATLGVPPRSQPGLSTVR
ncbi:MAG: hypothetical protein M1522_04635, partial [Actinobacteria bacterium]|nr:hypothetical protein [Actinomycetota bacterium]